MKITFDYTTSQNVDMDTTAYRTGRSSRAGREEGVTRDISGKVMDNAAYGVHGRTTEEIMQEAENQDVTLLRNYMTVMSNSMSTEDFARLQREGGGAGDMDMETAVTIVDRIKAELAKAGVDVAGYTDDIDGDTLREITGSEAYAQAILHAFHAEDIPVTEENARQAVRAAGQAAELSPISEGTAKYMVSNAMDPTIDNVYRAEYAGAADASRQGRGYYAEELPGYYARKADGYDTEGLQPQIEKAIVQAGLEVSQDTVADAKWLIEKGVPLTTENLSRMEELKQVKLPVKEEEVLPAIAGALAEGRKAGDANLYDGRSCYRKAADADAEIDALLKEAVESGNVTARRQLEEIRLKMTAEANVKLIQSGFSIDTSKLEELVEALTKVEKEQAQKLFGDTQDPEGAYDLYRDTLDKTAAIPSLPAAVVGQLTENPSDNTLQDVYREGKALQSSYEKAGESYEALMTSPRRDMGDNIRKAFRNVDDILQEMNIPLTQENRRAVRILGYNSMEITQESIREVSEADRKVQSLVERMTPSATLHMIRDGVNPLETSFEELEQYLGNIEDGGETAKYSRYLYRLEQNKEISPEEKEAYIGIYRMLRQLEKTDGAAVGSIVDSGAQISFSNLLTAVRTAKSKGMDVKIDESFGMLESLESKGISITEQIKAGYTEGLTGILTTQAEAMQAQDADYVKQTASEARRIVEDASQARGMEREVLSMLERSGMPATLNNVAAAAILHKDGGFPWRKLKEATDREEATLGKSLEEATGQTEQIFDSAEDVQEAYRQWLEPVEELAGEAAFAEGMTSVDVRSMQLVHKQLALAAGAALGEEYYIPVSIDGELTAMHLKLEHGKDSKGTVSISAESTRFGSCDARFTMDGATVTGYMTAGLEEGLGILKQIAEKLPEAFGENGWQPGRLDVYKGEGARENKAPEASGEAKNRDLYQLAKTFITVYRQSAQQSGNGRI